MRRVFAVIELHEGSSFDPSNDADLDALAEDLLCVTHAVKSATVYGVLAEMVADEGE